MTQYEYGCGCKVKPGLYFWQIIGDVRHWDEAPVVEGEYIAFEVEDE